MIGGSGAETVATGRFSRPVSRTAEDVSVVTAEEIEAHNAHTLADVLNLIPGLQLEMQTGPASAVTLSLQGADFNHVLVLLDGIQWNSLVANFADVGAIPAQIIERVEVAKGAASSSWGPALGGVINVITKSPDLDRKITGFASGSHGEHDTTDARGEVSGTLGSFGYYLAGGFFGTGGFHPNNHERLPNAYQKVTYDFPGDGRAVFAFGYSEVNRGEFETAGGSSEDGDTRRLTFSLSATKPLSERFNLEIAGRHSRIDSHKVDVLAPAFPPLETELTEQISGGSLKLLWHGSDNALVLGGDFDRDTMHLSGQQEKGATRLGLYLNGSYSLGRLTVAPGVRYDRTGNAGDTWSPSFGATFQVGENTTLRGYVAKGYSIPSLLLDTLEKVWTAQVGAETSSVPYLWLKGTFFHNEVDSFSVRRDVQHLVKEGFEAEVRTAPFWNTSLSLGYTFVDTRVTATDTIVPDRLRHLLLLGGRYDDGRLLRVVVLGRQVDWNTRNAVGAAYGAMIWDGHLTLTPFGREELMPQFFFSVHNAFNGNQYLFPEFKNPGRWLEGGVRWRF